MFSPALVSMLVHRLGRDPDESTPPPLNSLYEVSRWLSDRVSRLRLQDWPRLPVVGRTRDYPDVFTQWFGDSVTIDPRDDRTFFWGRVPVDRLIKFLLEFREFTPEQQYIDLGTPIRPAGSGSSFDADCASYLKQSSQGNPKVDAAIVDLGDDHQGAPDDYGGQLQHAVTANITLSEHAEKVLSVLLERLFANGVLGDTRVSCALVRRPAAMIAAGKGALDQVNATEMLDALQALDTLLNNGSVSTIINMSLGTHVGPHNGASPLEEYVATTMFQSGKRFLAAAGGNDGGKGLAAKRYLTAGERDYLRLRTGARCREALVEFWWDDAASADLTINADVQQPFGTGGSSSLGSVFISNGTPGVLSTAPAGLPQSMVSQSLFSARCSKTMNCIAYAISSTTTKPLPQLEIRFTLESASDVIVNAWIVVAEVDPQTAFIEGGQQGTIMVPASDPAVLSVAGSESSGQIWQDSSRGPSAEYQPGNPATHSPLMAHLVRLHGEAGTSFSSPRASGDVAAVLADPMRMQNCSDALDLVCEAYSLQRRSLPPWNVRSGYYKAIK